MKVSGFTFIRNGIKYDYPFREAIRSILPIVDECVVAVGRSDDHTLEAVKDLGPKVKILETDWDDDLRESGLVLSDETNKAFKAIDPESTWAVYIQGDEAMHEQDHDKIRAAMKKWKDHRRVEGLLFNYLHFYGSYDYIGASTRWYRHEIRIIRNDPDIYSYKDAQGFRKRPSKKLRVKPIDATIYHYGWVRKPEAMEEKLKEFGKFWKGDDWKKDAKYPADGFDYSGLEALNKFKGTHPEVMLKRIEKSNWKFERDISRSGLSLKDKLKYGIEKLTGHRIGEYKNYRII